MKNFTQALISKVGESGGSFYLPYRLHYNEYLLKNIYPEITDWIQMKRLYDPNIILYSNFFDYIQKLQI